MCSWCHILVPFDREICVVVPLVFSFCFNGESQVLSYRFHTEGSLSLAANRMDLHAFEVPHTAPKKRPRSFWSSLLRYIFPVKLGQVYPVSPPLHPRPPPRRLRKRRRPSRPSLPMLRDGDHPMTSMSHSWSPIFEPQEIPELGYKEGGEDDYGLLLCCHLSRFVPHTLETIEEVDGEYAYSQGRKTALRRQSVHF